MSNFFTFSFLTTGLVNINSSKDVITKKANNITVSVLYKLTSEVIKAPKANHIVTRLTVISSIITKIIKKINHTSVTSTSFIKKILLRVDTLSQKNKRLEFAL